MGVGHLSPSRTRRRGQEIIDYKGKHSDTTDIEDRFIAEHKENTVVEYFTREYGFEELNEPEWATDHQKVVAMTKHGVELRVMYHPSGTSVYYYFVAVTSERNKHNLGVRHLETYHEELLEILDGVYGNVRTKTSAWTSKEIEV